jgi:hypothetical protein
VPLTHAGKPVVGQAKVVAEPLSPLQPVHVLVAVLQKAVAPIQALVLDAVHCRHAPPLHTGAREVGHGRLVLAPKLPVHC